MVNGRNLPDLYPNEVEIARVVLNSTTMDVKSIRARRGKSRIYYRIVDEYPEYGDQFYLTKKSSIKPLTFEELTNMIENAIEGGLVGGYRDSNYNVGCCTPDEIFDFANAFSVYYKELSSWYDEINYEWLLEKQEEVRKAEEEEPEDFDLPSAADVDIGPELLRLLDLWAKNQNSKWKRKGGVGGVEWINYIANTLAGRGKEVLNYLNDDGSEESKIIEQNIINIANRHFHKNWMAIVYNAPLSIVKKEVLGEIHTKLPEWYKAKYGEIY